ncbi:hypothetical protein GV791_14850 [Nocardia cyriacigeorgica]|uniref:Scaffolding protein n=1 Tax=Nocardia cyriacigeorgica TaxID=135487 RepID=A0A6P1CR24_9NOCA|nr:hypothetical protein [Nocardia cyriacigeorgica]NEW33834.1 hypothetical protein [Nocardia cyriacigeorgica]
MSDNPNPLDGVTQTEVILQGQAIGEAVQPPPAPAPAAAQPPVPESPPASDTPAPKTPEEYEAMIRDLRKENASWRTKLREAEPIIRAHNEAEEAAKTEVQRATERAAAAEQAAADLIREVVAKTYGVPEEDYDFLGSGTREEMEAKGARYAARFAATSTPTPPPPSDRPVESLRPGASPTPPPPADHSYPAAWKP